MKLKRDITLFDGAEPITVCYTCENFETSDTAIEIYDRCKLSVLMTDGLAAVSGERVINSGVGSVLYFRPDEIHFGRIFRSGEQKFLDFFLPLSLAHSLFDNTAFRIFTDTSSRRINFIMPGIEDKKKITEISENAVELLSSDEPHDALLFSLLLQLADICDRLFELQDSSESSLPPVVTRTMLRITRSFGEPLSLKTLAAEVGCSVTYLSRVFKQCAGMTVYEYLTAVRIANAGILLRGGATVTEACYASGFGDCSAFIRSFKKHTGKTPLCFKNTSTSLDKKRS